MVAHSLRWAWVENIANCPRGQETGVTINEKSPGTIDELLIAPRLFSSFAQARHNCPRARWRNLPPHV